MAFDRSATEAAAKEEKAASRSQEQGPDDEPRPHGRRAAHRAGGALPGLAQRRKAAVTRYPRPRRPAGRAGAGRGPPRRARPPSAPGRPCRRRRPAAGWPRASAAEPRSERAALPSAVPTSTTRSPSSSTASPTRSPRSCGAGWLTGERDGPRPRRLTGAQKAAVFILHMGKDRSAEVLRSMRESEVAEIMAEVARMRTVNSTVVEEVVGEFKEMAEAKVTITAGGLELARTPAGGEPRRRQGHRDPRPGHGLADRAALRVPAPGRPPPGAVVHPGRAPPDDRPRPRLHDARPGGHGHERPGRGRSSATSPCAWRSWTAPAPRSSPTSSRCWSASCRRCCSPASCRRSAGCRASSTSSTGPTGPPSASSSKGLENNDSELADEVRQRMFVFEDIAGLDDRSIQLVLRQVDSKELAVALKGVRPGGPQRHHPQHVGAGRAPTSSRRSTCSAPSGSRPSKRRRAPSSGSSGRSRSRASWSSVRSADEFVE